MEGTLAKEILKEPEEVTTMSGQRLPMKCSVEYISFSAHTDFEQTTHFIRTIHPPNVVRGCGGGKGVWAGKRVFVDGCGWERGGREGVWEFVWVERGVERDVCMWVCEVGGERVCVGGVRRGGKRVCVWVGWVGIWVEECVCVDG